MKLCIDWEAIHQDWQASGLSKNRYFLNGRIEKFIREGVAPCYSTFLRVQAGVGGIAMQRPNRHRVLPILLGFKWKIRIILGLPWIVRIEIRLRTKGGNS